MASLEELNALQLEGMGTYSTAANSRMKLTRVYLAVQAHFAQVTARDEAMSRSLNSDYLDQLLIRADTSRLDADLVREAAEGRAVPEEEHALVVFKRGCASFRVSLCILFFVCHGFQEHTLPCKMPCEEHSIALQG